MVDVALGMRGLLLLPSSLALLFAGCGEGPSPSTANQPRDHERLIASIGLDPERWERARSMAALPELPADPTNRFADDPTAVSLGHHLFFDPRLSGNSNVSCATCHDPARDFTDGRTVAVGMGTSSRNTPTVLNAAHHRWLTWDGRSDSLIFRFWV